MSSSGRLSAIVNAGVIAVLRAATAEGALRAVDALVDGGISGIEITYSTPDAASVIAALRSRYEDDVVIGAGTVLTPAQATAAARAGALFLVSPGLDDGVVAAMLETGATTLAGALTPTEVMRALRLGVDAVKLFPGSFVGPGYLRALRGPFPDLPVVPTGGVSADNVDAWFSAGALAVGAGSELVSAADIGSRRWDVIRANAARFTSALDAVRGARPVA